MGNLQCNCLQVIDNKYEINNNSHQNHEELETNGNKITINNNDLDRTSDIHLKAKVGQTIEDEYVPHKTEKSIDFNESNIPGQTIESPDMSNKEMDKLGTCKLSDDQQKYVGEGLESGKLRVYTLLEPDNIIYEGCYNSKWEKDGKGCIYYPTGSRLEGFFENNFIKTGRLINSELDYYEGKLVYLFRRI
jgi:hypothetical protein